MNLGTRGALTFRLGEYWFAVRVEEAAGVLEAERLAQLPGPTAPIAGLAAFRGEMVPVIDLAAYLGIDAPMKGPRYALVLARGIDRFAILVPEIPQLVPGHALNEAPTPSDPDLGDLFESVLETDTDRYHCLNYWRIFEDIAPVPSGAGSRVPAAVEN